MLVLLTGLPGTGKSTIAAAVARALPAALLSADPIDAALIRAGMSPAQRPDKAGYEVMKALAAEQLAVGTAVVIDAVNPFHFVRQAYLDIAAAHAAPVAVIITRCSDVATHRRRIEARHNAGLKAIDWAGVERQMDYYEPFAGDALTLDAMDPVAATLAAALAYVAARRR